MDYLAKDNSYVWDFGDGIAHQWTPGTRYPLRFSRDLVTVISDTGTSFLQWERLPIPLFAEVFGIDIVAKRRMYEEDSV